MPIGILSVVKAALVPLPLFGTELLPMERLMGWLVGDFANDKFNKQENKTDHE